MPDFGIYLLCITIIDKEVGEIIFEVDIGELICLEGMETDFLALYIMDPHNVETLGLIDLLVENVIMNCNNKIVKENQIYKDNTTLISVMAKYAIENTFNFHALISEKQIYI